ncbi:NAD-dependent epimerase/dehydratase family protein [Bacteroidota bacterium]
MKNTNRINALITGSSGFMGKYLVSEFLDKDCPIKINKLIGFDQHENDAINDERFSFIKGDVRNFQDVLEACKGIDLVVHAAAIVDWGTRPESEVYDVNVKGTENIVKACKENNVKAMIFTSSLDAVFTGKPQVDIDESVPYPEKFHSMYCKSKCLGEKIVLSENSESFRTCALRPSDVYGEDDPYHIESLINMAKSGFYVRLGNGKSKSQHVYVGNIAYAHVLAGKALLENNEKIGGNAYFITDSKGTNFFKFFDNIVLYSGYKIWPKNIWIPIKIAYTMGAISEFVAILARPIKKYNPKFSRFAVTYTCNDFTFSSKKATNDFGFKPKYSQEEAFKRTIDFYKKPGK